MSVVTVDNRRYNVGKRVATIIEWEARNADEIETPISLKLEIDCAGQNVIAKKIVGEKLNPIA